jgi:modulator of FtsH protease
VSESLVDWRDFYSAVAEAGGALLGLLFVAITIRLDRHPRDVHARALGMGAIVALLHPLLASLAMLLPVAAPAQGIALLVLATSGLIATVRIASFETRHPGRETRLAAVFRYFLPLAAEVLLALAALALLVESQLGLYALPVFMTLMFIVGTQDAIDLLLGTTLVVRPKGDLFQVSGDDALAVNDDADLQGHRPAPDADRGALHLTP